MMAALPALGNNSNFRRRGHHCPTMASATHANSGFTFIQEVGCPSEYWLVRLSTAETSAFKNY